MAPEGHHSRRDSTVIKQADIEQLENVVHRVAILKDNHPEVALIEINPLVVSDRSVSVLAVDIRVADAARRTDSARRAVSFS